EPVGEAECSVRARRALADGAQWSVDDTVAAVPSRAQPPAGALGKRRGEKRLRERGAGQASGAHLASELGEVPAASEIGEAVGMRGRRIAREDLVAALSVEHHFEP